MVTNTVRKVMHRHFQQLFTYWKESRELSYVTWSLLIHRKTLWFYHFYFRLDFFGFFLLIWSQLLHPLVVRGYGSGCFCLGQKGEPDICCVQCPWAWWEQDMAWAAGAAALSLSLHGKAIPFPFLPRWLWPPWRGNPALWSLEELNHLVTKHSQLIKSFLESSLWSLFRCQSIPVL